MTARGIRMSNAFVIPPTSPRIVVKGNTPARNSAEAIWPGADQNSDPNWKAGLIVTDKGAPRALLANCLHALRLSPEMSGVLAYDEMRERITVRGKTPWRCAPGLEWCDNQDRLLAEWLQHQGMLISVEIAAQAAQTVAQENGFHPLREYLNALKWDGNPRVGTWLRDYLGVEDCDYARAVGQRWLISLIARPMEPGCKADCCLIIEKGQGGFKSTAVKVLGGEYFTDELADLGSKDAALQTRGAWVIEIAELDSMNRSEVGRIKAFMSRSTDRFRPPYGRRVIESPRQCIFAGTVNHATYLKDETGARRFWPITAHMIDIKKLEQDRDQLFAEAVELYRSGSPWWLNTPELVDVAAQEQLARFEGDPWDDKIAHWILTRQDVTINDILEHCLDKAAQSWQPQDKIRVGRCLRSLGWVRFHASVGGVRTWKFRAGDSDE